MLTRQELSQYLHHLLQPESVKDYCPNGLQVEGKAIIKRVITGVSASQALLDAAVAANADAIIVHHGYFWQGEDPRVIGIKKNRLQTLLQHDINLYAYHLPLDVHPELGNNAKLAERLAIEVTDRMTVDGIAGLLYTGRFEEAITVTQLTQRIEKTFQRKPFFVSSHEKPIQHLAWCTGAGQRYLPQVSEMNMDAYITGEVSEQTVHIARETGCHFIAAGHHATECDGVRALGEHLAEEYDIDVKFLNINNPV